MAEKNVFFKSEEPKERAQIVQFLKELAEKLTEGKIILRKGTEEITLTIPSQLILEVKAEEKIKGKKKKHSLEIELEWTEGDEGPLSLG